MPILRPLAVAVVLVSCAPLARVSAAEAEAASASARGVIAGSVFDESTGMPLLGVEVSVEGQPYRGSSDLGGRFKVEDLPEGTHTVVFRLDRFNTARIEGVKVGAGTAANVEISLKPLGENVLEMEEMTVSAQAAENSAAGLVALRRRMPVSVDALSGIEISKFVATDVADVFGRLPGASITRGKFAVVRGLAERYNPVTLDGVPLPSADPERQTPKLDQFPTRLIDGLVVSKNFAPNLPSFATGGSVDLRTMSIPSASYTELQFGVRADEGAFHHADYLTYPTNGHGDSLANGKPDRDTYAIQGEGGGPIVNGRTIMIPRVGTVPLGWKFGAAHGDVHEFSAGRRKLGYNFVLSYDSSFSSRELEVDQRVVENVTDLRSGRLQNPNDGSYRYISEEEVLLGGAASIGYTVGGHELGARAFVSRTGNDTTQFIEARYAGRANYSASEVYAFSYDLDYRQRLLTDFGLYGRHVLSPAREIELRWRADAIRAREDQPDARSSYFLQRLRDGELFMTSADAYPTIERFWRETEEKTKNGLFDLSWPLTSLGRDGLLLDVGGTIEKTERTYFEADNSGIESAATRFVFFEPLSLEGFLEGKSRAGALFTRAEGNRRLAAGYAMLQWPVRPQLRFTAGVRLEKLEINSTGLGRLGNLTSKDLYASDEGGFIFPGIDPQNPATAILRKAAYPAAILNYSPVPKANVRVSWSKTVARPSFRELGSYFTRDLRDGTLIHGNATLKPSPVENRDLRLEYFFAGTDLVALSFFSKTIDRPIERTNGRFPAGGFQTWVNNPGKAQLSGLEFEVRKNLAFIAGWLSPFTIGGNYSRIDAEVPLLYFERANLIGGFPDPAMIPAKRRLYDQPEWLANADLTWKSESWGAQVTAAYQASSDVLYAASANRERYGLYTAKSGQFDVSWSQRLPWDWKAKLTAKNLTDPLRKIVYDPTLTDREYVYSRTHDGRSFTLTISRSF